MKAQCNSRTHAIPGRAKTKPDSNRVKCWIAGGHSDFHANDFFYGNPFTKTSNPRKT